MTIQKPVKATLVTLASMAGVAATVLLLSAAIIVIVVLLGLWVAARIAGAAARMIP